MSSVYLGNINPGLVRSAMAASVAQAVADAAVTYVYYQESAPYLDVERNKIVAHFLDERDDDKLLFVDSDIQFTPDDVRALDAVDEDVVSGWYRNPVDGGSVQPVLYWWGKDGPHTKMIQYKTDADIAGLPEVKDRVSVVSAGGTGFLMISRDCLVKMSEVFGLPQPWFIEQQVVGADGEDPCWHGEDLMFGMRAAQLGFPWHVHKDVIVPHYKTAKI